MLKLFVIGIIHLVSLVAAVLPTDPSICDAYVPSNAASQEILLDNFASQLGADLTLGGLARFFDGSIADTTNFKNDTAKFSILLQHWAEFFGSSSVMNCTDPAFPAFSGNSNLTAVHGKLPITVKDFADYVELFLNSAAFQSIDEADRDKLRVILFSFRYSICLNQNDPQCNPGSVCDKLAIAGSISGNTLVAKIVDELVDSLFNSSLQSFFDGTASGAKNFSDPSNSQLLLVFKEHLVEFFADEVLMGCTDRSVGSYSGLPMSQAHQSLDIGKIEVEAFNAVVLEVLGNNGFSADDLTAIGNRLAVIGQSICNQPGCFEAPIFPVDEGDGASSITVSVFAMLVMFVALLL